MTAPAPARAQASRSWRSTAAGSVVLSADFYVGVPLGLVCSLPVVFSGGVANATQTVLLGISAIAGALVALVLTAVSVLVVVITPAFGKFLDKTPRGLAGLIRPYRWVIGVSAVSCGAAVSAALAWPWLQSLWFMRLLAAGVPLATLMWGLGGCLQIIGLTTKIINQSRQVTDLNERAAALRRRA